VYRPDDKETSAMSVIHTFTSSSGSGLCAFTGDADGHRLPVRHGPWKHTGSVQPNRDLPHKLDRSTVETAIETHGFQMWRPRRPVD
jgi:hypothetical protein